MRRLAVYFIVAIITIYGAVAAAQPDIPPFIPITTEPQTQEPFTYTVPLEPATWEETITQLPQAPQASPPTDLCDSAPTLNLSLPADGGQAVVNNYTESGSDPDLTCNYGSPPRPEGYRTAWYKVTAPTSGVLVVEALPNSDYRDNYDTIIAIHTGSCNTLTTIACNDDTNGFLSKATALVQQGSTYYIEAADWQYGVNGTARLNLIAYITAASSYWEYINHLPAALSRHIAIKVGSDFYIMGGQNTTGSAPERSRTNRKFLTTTGQWFTMAPIPSVTGTCLDIYGYAATDAAYINDWIYIPSGYAGNNNSYCGVHLAYQVSTDTWTTAPSAPWTAPLGWTQVVQRNNGYFVVGGLTGAPLTATANPSSQTYFFATGATPDDGYWTALPSMARARYGHTAVLLNNELCVVGGIGVNNGNSVVISDGECYDDQSWSTIAPLNFPRFNAGSAIGPDGRWYVFGGSNAAHISVPQVEVYDSVNNTWQVLDSRYNLGTVNGLDRPSRSWVRGEFVGQTLWVFGGEQDVGVFNAGLPLRIVERLTLATNYAEKLSLPLLSYRPSSGEPDDTMALAQPLALFQTAAANFTENDYHDVYAFTLPQDGQARVYLQNIPSGADYDILLYDANKTLKGTSRNVGNQNEYIERSLSAGLYYVMVVRAFPLSSPPPSGYYTLRVEN